MISLFLLSLTFLIPSISHYKFADTLHQLTDGDSPPPSILDSALYPFITLKHQLQILLTSRSTMEDDILNDMAMHSDDEEEFLAKQEAETKAVKATTKKPVKH